MSTLSQDDFLNILSLAREKTQPMPDDRLFGWVALVLTIIIWAGFSLSIRAIGRSALTPADVALIRFTIPALALLPFLPSRRTALKGIKLQHAAMISCGAGLPFFLVAALGGKLTSAAHVSALITGTLPLSVALIGGLFFRETAWRSRLHGLAAITIGVLMLVAGLQRTGNGMAEGVTLLLIASLLWGMYTLGLRQVALDPIGCVMLASYPSAILAALLVASGVWNSHLVHTRFSDLLPFLIVQGLGAGITSTLTYSFAIRRLDAHLCSTVGALQPALTTIAAIPLLGEVPTFLSLGGVVVVIAGVLLTNRRSAERNF